MDVFYYHDRSKKSFKEFIYEKKLMEYNHLFILISGLTYEETEPLSQLISMHWPGLDSSDVFYNIGSHVEHLLGPMITFFASNHEEAIHSNHRLLNSTMDEEKKDRSRHSLFQDSEALFHHNPNVVIWINREGMVLNLNKATEKQLGYAKSDILSRSAIHIVKMEDRERALNYFAKASKGEAMTARLEICDRNGRPQPYEVTFIPAAMADGVQGFYIVGINKTAEKEAETKLSHFAYHDSLTGLANRFLFEQSLNYMIKQAQSRDEKLAVLFLDLDRFKLINDTSGHFVGDRILQQAVERIKGELAPNQLLARFEGDKFSIIMPQIKGQFEVDQLAKHIQDAFEPAFMFEEAEFFLSISIGVSLFPNDGFNDEQLMKNADIALFSAKSKAHSRLAYYTVQMNSDFNDRIEFESYLRKALRKNEFILYYQPQISIETGELSGCEALIRWNHPKLGLVSPIHFIPLAEEIGLIEEIGFWVLETACRQIRKWQNQGWIPFPISINVSFRQFLKSDFVLQVQEIIQSSDINPKWIHLEITESTTAQDLQYSIGLVKQLKQIGISVSLDDFGTGYSALSVLKDFTLDILKIDRSFIRNLSEVDEDRAIVKAIIMMCKGLHLKTIAEGVETVEQLELLKQFGCEMAQGFYYSKPVPSQQFETKFLKVSSF